MNKRKADSDKQHPRKRKREQKGINSKEQNDVVGIDKLPNDMLIDILSRVSLKEAVRTSVIASRWRYLWTSRSGSLEFDDGNRKIKRKKFKTWVNSVLKLHQGQGVDSLVIPFTNLRSRARSSDIDSWIYFAMQKELKVFELNLSVVQNGFHCNYKFPTVDKLLSNIKSVSGSLRSLRLIDVDIEDEVIQYILASCHFIEHLCIRASNATKNLETVDPLVPNLKELEISDCCNLQSMEISAAALVSCTYQGDKIDLPFKTTPHLTELTLGGLFWMSFLYEPYKHLSYSATLVKLVLNIKTVSRQIRIASTPNLPQLYSLKMLEVNAVAFACQSLLFFVLLIKASPNLQEFKIKMEYLRSDKLPRELQIPYPRISSSDASGIHHKNLKVVEIGGFISHSGDEEFLLQLCKAAPSIESVFIDTYSSYYSDCRYSDRCLGDMKQHEEAAIRLRGHMKGVAMKLKSQFPPETKFIVT